jgi:hypothetical protein
VAWPETRRVAFNVPRAPDGPVGLQGGAVDRPPYSLVEILGLLLYEHGPGRKNPDFNPAPVAVRD